MASSSSSSRRRRRLWKFSGAEFDEASWALRVDGHAVPLEGKPLEVLHELLLRAGEVVTKDEILDAVWPGLTVVEGSLPTAISKLRKALGERQDNIIETVPRVGYRLTGSVQIASVESPLAPRFTFKPGDRVPGRKQWCLARPLGDSGADDVWVGTHEKTGERRVFKFADAPDRLRALKREAALSRVVFAGMGQRAPLPALLEWNFEAPPYFLEYAYGGQDLIEWAAAAGGLKAVGLDTRLAIAAQIARAVGEVHQLGVLHKDLKPANVLIVDSEGQEPKITLADFGSGRLLDDTVLDTFGITNPGSLDTGLVRDEPRSGTLAYRAPELVGDAVPTAASDIYALGLMLFQLVVGDFTRALAPGWESDVSDPLLRDDIRCAAAGDPSRRLASASLLAERISQLADRRKAAEMADRQATELAAIRAAEVRRAQRRPWVRAAAASLIAGLIASCGFGAYAWAQRNKAVEAGKLADTSYSFVAEDVLGSADPAKANGADETVGAAMKRAGASIDVRYAGQPAIAARLHLALGRAFYGRSDFDTARTEFTRAETLFQQAGEKTSDDAVLARLTLAHMDSVSGQPERLEAAGKELAAERKGLGQRADQGKVGFALAQAEGAYGYMADLELAERSFRRAVKIAETDPDAASATQVLKAKSSLVLVLMRLGRPQDAEPMARQVIAESTKVRGADHPDTLVTRQHWVNALSMLGKNEAAIKESGPLLAQMEQRLGRDHRFTLALHSTRFDSFAAMGRLDEAANEARQVWQGAERWAGPDSHQALVGEIDYAAALCQTFRRAEGLAVARQSLGKVRAAFGPDYPLTHAIRYYTAECLIANDRAAEAGQLLAGLDRQKVAELTGQADFGGLVDLALGEIAMARGERRQALNAYRAAQSALARNTDNAVRKRLSALRREIGPG